MYATNAISDKCETCGVEIGASVVELRNHLVSGVRAVRKSDTRDGIHAQVFTDSMATEVELEILEGEELRLLDP